MLDDTSKTSFVSVLFFVVADHRTNSSLAKWGRGRGAGGGGRGAGGGDKTDRSILGVLLLRN